MHTMSMVISAFQDGAPVPSQFAFCTLTNESKVAFSQNISPGIRWGRVPMGTQSLVLLMHDMDALTQRYAKVQGSVVPKDAPRETFYHCVLVDIPRNLNYIPEGALSNGVVVGGKPCGVVDYGTWGQNDYTRWFMYDEKMSGVYGGYDGPCVPWNDPCVHRYVFTLYALDLLSLGLASNFDGREVVSAMSGHILATATWRGTYTLSAKLS